MMAITGSFFYTASTCKKHGQVCRQRKFMNNNILKFNTDEDHYTAEPILDLLDEIVEAEESKHQLTESFSKTSSTTKKTPLEFSFTAFERR